VDRSIDSSGKSVAGPVYRADQKWTHASPLVPPEWKVQFLTIGFRQAIVPALPVSAD
jgi:hypothetical protein